MYYLKVMSLLFLGKEGKRRRGTPCRIIKNSRGEGGQIKRESGGKKEKKERRRTRLSGSILPRQRKRVGKDSHLIKGGVTHYSS